MYTVVIMVVINSDFEIVIKRYFLIHTQLAVERLPKYGLLVNTGKPWLPCVAKSIWVSTVYTFLFVYLVTPSFVSKKGTCTSFFIRR